MKKLQIRILLLPVLFLALFTASVCGANSPNYRSKAADAIEQVQKNAPPDSLYGEFGSILETFSRAEELFDQHKLDEADKLFQMVILKTSLYEKQFAALQSRASAAPVPLAKVTERNVAAGSDTRPAEPPSTPPAALSTARNQPPAPAAAAGTDSDNATAASRVIIGKKRIYTVRKGDTLRLIGAKFGVNWRQVAQQNHLNPKKTLHPGKKLTINTRRIVPKTVQEGIVINIPDRTLYLFKNRKLEKALPVGLGMTKWKDLLIWQTPTGKFRILSKIKDPAWHVPASIQRKMKEEGMEVKTIVPPGDDNPLGKFALKTSLPGILIHGTIFPESVYTFSSHGCIRVLPGNMEDIFNAIPVNTSGEIIYQPVKFALAEDGRVFLEVHRDVYDRHKNLQELAKSLIIRNHAESKVDWNKVNASLRRKAGVPEEITRTKQPQPILTSENRTTAGIPAIP